MSRVLAVAWRDFRATALTKAFIFGAVLIPCLLMGMLTAASVLFKPNIPPLQGTVVIMDEDGHVAAAAEIEATPERMNERVADTFAQFGELAEEAARAGAMPLPKVVLTIERVGPSADVEALKRRVATGDALAIAAYPAGLLPEPDAPGEDRPPPANGDEEPAALAVLVAQELSPNHAGLLQGLLRSAVVRARVTAAGQDFDEVKALLERPDVETRTITAEGRDEPSVGEFAIFVPMGFMLLLWVTTFTSANYLLTTTIEEKSNKVIEVLLSAVSPMQLLTGKVLGQALVSVIMLVMYGGMAILALVSFSLMHLIPWTHLVLLVLYFVMAYFMIAAMMAGVGSAVNELREAQSLVGPVMVVLIIPLMLWFFIQENPNGALATVTSFIPPLIPFVMILRATTPTEPVALWQIVASLVWGYVAMIAMIWMAAKVFRVGVLMYGKPPTPWELIKWLRYS